MHRFTALHRAAQKGDEEETRALLAAGSDPAAKDSEGRTPLHHAVMRGHLAVVEAVIDKGGPELLLSKDILGCTPVHLAAVQNQVTLILLLVTALLRDEKGTTPLHEIARRRCLQDFMGFLHLGWDVAAKEEEPGEADGPLTPEWQAVAAEIDLRRPGLTAVRITMGWSPLHMAAMEGKVQLIRRLVQEHGCSLSQRSANSWTPLHYAAAHNQVAAIEELVRLGCDAAVKDSVSSTPMHVAAGEGHLDAILLLVQLGCAAAAKDKDGCTPLYCAAAWNRLEAVRQLDALGCPSWVRSNEGRTPVHVAAEQGWVDLIDLLVRDLKNKVDSRDTYQFTPLHSAANGGHVRTIQKLIHFSHDVDVKDYLGRTPLHYAAMHGRVAAVEELVKQGADVHEKDVRGGYTPLHLAADAGQCEAIARLAALGAPLEARSTKNWTPLALATFKGPANVEAIGTLVELGSKVEAVLEYAALETPLHIAARCGRLDVIEKLLRCRVPVNVKAKDGSYPLHYAAAFGQSHVIETLVKAGCPVDSKDDAQNTPLHLAAGCGFLDTVEALVEMGADLNARDIMACTPLQNAAHGTYSALAAMPAAPANGAAGQRNSGIPGLPAPHGSQAAQPALTPAQTAAQLALNTGSAARNGKVPVRTGLAWAALAGAAGDLASSALWGSATAGTAANAGSNTSLGLMQLLKCATRRRNGSSTPAADFSLGTMGVKGESDRVLDGSLEALLRRSEALQAGGLEQDRSRLLTVASRLVQLGAQVDARDAEGRTALHLAAGCGDAAMVLQLVDLGTDVNCRDSVGGTPMHHAAMANKKEMMFELARLGCDWRSRAEGIDGATAAFVLCGQHGKTTRQQKLVEAKLKRVFQEGLVARSQGQQLSKLPDSLADLEDEEEDAEALADANMAALLEQVQLEDQGSKSGMAKRKRKKKRGGKGRAVGVDDDSKASEDGLPDEPLSPRDSSQDPATPREEDLFEAALEEPSTSRAPNSLTAAQLALSLRDAVHATSNGHLPDDSSALRSKGQDGDLRKSAAANGEHAKAEDARTDLDKAAQAQEDARSALDAVVAHALSVLDGSEGMTAAKRERALEDAADGLDQAIAVATAAEVSAKYAKKVRRRLQGALDALHGITPSPRPEKQAPTPTGPQDNTREQVAGGGQHAESTQKSGKANGFAVVDDAAEQAHAQASPRPLAAHTPATIHVTKSPRRATSPLHNGSGSAAQASHQRSISLDSDLGVEVQKPLPQAALSRTPKRIIAAKEALTQPRKLNAVPPAVAVKVTAPTTHPTKNGAPQRQPRSSQSQAHKPAMVAQAPPSLRTSSEWPALASAPLTARSEPFSAAPPAPPPGPPDRTRAFGTQQAPMPKQVSSQRSSLDRSSGTASPAPQLGLERVNSLVHSQPPPGFGHLATGRQTSYASLPMSSQPPLRDADFHQSQQQQQMALQQQSLPALGGRQPTNGLKVPQPVGSFAQPRVPQPRYSDLSAAAPDWVPTGASQASRGAQNGLSGLGSMQGVDAGLVGGLKPYLGTSSWGQISQPSSGIAFSPTVGSGISRGGTPQPPHQDSSLFSWMPNASGAENPAGMLMQSQVLWSSSSAGQDTWGLAREEATASWQVGGADTNGPGSPEYAAFMMDNCGPELAASVLASEDRQPRPSLPLGAFSHQPARQDMPITQSRAGSRYQW